MQKTNRTWLPPYCNPEAFLPKIPETGTLFSHAPYLFQDFIGRALRFLQGKEAAKMGFDYSPEKILPCRWKCADESVFGATMALYAYMGQYPFDKGGIGGMFNEGSLGAATHHGLINVDFGGSHTGYIPGSNGGSFGRIWRPLKNEYSTDCGYLMNVLGPFSEVFEDACNSIRIFTPEGGKTMISIPNEFIQPNWSSHSVKLMVDLDTLTCGDVQYEPNKAHTHTAIGRSLFYLNPAFIEALPKDAVKGYMQTSELAIGRNLTHQYFNIFDTEAQLDKHGIPELRLNLYMKYILSARQSPPALKAAIVNTNLEYNKLTDAVRLPPYRNYCFTSFTGVFLDLFFEPLNNYVNLFLPMGITIKPAGSTDCFELLPEEIFAKFDRLEPVEPVLLSGHMAELANKKEILDLFTYEPGKFSLE